MPLTPTRNSRITCNKSLIIRCAYCKRKRGVIAANDCSEQIVGGIRSYWKQSWLVWLFGLGKGEFVWLIFVSITTEKASIRLRTTVEEHRDSSTATERGRFICYRYPIHIQSFVKKCICF